jgi:uncharacterized protein YjdB
MDMSMATVTGVAAGMATITVTGTDSDGGMGSQQIMVTVEAASENMPPMAPTLDAVMLMEGGDAMTVDAAFTDPEDGMLTYTQMTSNAMVATAMVDAMGMVTITPMGAGMATITVTGTDSDGGMGSQQIMVTVEAAPENMPPMAPTVDAVMLMEGGDAMTVDAAFTDPDGDDAMLTYEAMSDDMKTGC